MMGGGSLGGCHQCLLATGRSVCGAKLACLLPDLHHFVLRQQTRELYILQRAGCDHDASYRRRGTGFRHIEDYQEPGPSVGVLYIEINLPPAASISFLAASERLVVGFSMMLLRARGVYCPVRQKCMAIYSL